MNEIGPVMTGAGLSPLRPESELTIYYFSGQLPPNTHIADTDYVGNWEEQGFSFLFFTGPARQTVEALMAAHPQITLIDEYRLSYAEWLGETPVSTRVGRFMITPAWETPPEVEVSADFHILWLDPGVVFGTGTHPTTRDCLAAIEAAHRRTTPRITMDLGTGTGVLALASARLGTGKVLAVDLNPLAVQTAQKNIQLNRMEHRVLAVRADARDFACRPADLMIANLHYDAMRRLLDAQSFSRCKHFILSGLLRSEAREVAHRLSHTSARILEQWSGDGVWYTFYGQNSPGNKSAFNGEQAYRQ
jgi:ribosomal protein L11 methyltransferase